MCAPQAEEAAWQRAEADARYEAASQELESERSRMSQVEVGAQFLLSFSFLLFLHVSPAARASWRRVHL